HIKTNLLFSLWAKGGIISRQKAYKVLSEMNKLGFLNKVIANDEIYNQYQKQKSKLFDFHSHGIIKLMDSDEDFELYRLLKTSISKGDDE
ncbi:hypothetical protein IJ531_07125, partial [bacterium]|nr:hypothetical protein [bacterium]